MDAPTIDNFATFYMEELFDSFDIENDNPGELNYQRLRFMFSESVDRYISSSTIWLSSPISRDNLEADSRMSNVADSPDRIERSARNKRMISDIYHEQSITIGVAGYQRLQQSTPLLNNSENVNSSNSSTSSNSNRQSNGSSGL